MEEHTTTPSTPEVETIDEDEVQEDEGDHVKT